MLRWSKPAVHGASRLVHRTNLHATKKFIYCTHVTRRIAPPSSFAALSDFLSPRNTTTKHSLDTLRRLYASVKAQGRLHLFSPKQLSELISLFGTVSLQDPRNGPVYLSKRAPCVAPRDDDGEQWEFLIEVARDKQQTLKTPLTETDEFWLMRALLTKVVLAEGERAAGARPLSDATRHYLRVWRHASGRPLLQKWLDVGTHAETADLVNRLCRALELHIYPNSRLIELLWRLVLRRTRPLVPALKARILAMVTTRLSPRFTEARTAHTEPRPQPQPQPAPAPAHHRALGTPELSTALSTALFPTPQTRSVPPEVHHWATEQARRAFAPAVAPDVQWGNLLLLAIHQSELAAPPRAPEDGSSGAAGGESPGDWRPVLVLDALERGGAGVLAPDARESVQGVVRPLWRTWKAGDDGSRSVDVVTSRPIAAAFFRLAARVVDGPLTDACYRFCVKHDLFRGGEKLAEEAVHSWADLNAAYVLAVAACRGVGWQAAFEETHISGSRELVLSTLFFHYVLTDLRVGYQVYRYALQRGYTLAERPLHMMEMKLATPRTWQLAVPLLERPGISRRRQEELLIAILRVLQTERMQSVEPRLAKMIGDALMKLYEDTAPHSKFKYPIRFVFCIMIASEHPARAIAIVEAIHRNVPDFQSFFTIRLLLRLMRTLVRYRYFHLTHRVHRLVPTDPAHARAAADFRRKLTHSLARAGAHSAARRAYGYGLDLKKDKVWRTPREAMAHAVRFNARTPVAKHTLPVVAMLRRAPTHPPTILYAVTLLVRAHRASAARRVLERALPHLDGRIVTNIGNTILDGVLTRHVVRNGRLVRHVMRLRAQMEERYGFRADRVTVNIMIKSLLRWRGVVDAPKIRGLFDHMVRCGYPASEQWLMRGAGTPFGTSAAGVAVNIADVDEKIVFEKHVRPLYRMFIKALFTRGDRAAARKVVGILKEEEGRAARMRLERNQARWEGVQRKKAGKAKVRQ